MAQHRDSRKISSIPLVFRLSMATALGATLLALFSTIQKMSLGVVLTWDSYIVPVAFGGGAGFLVGLYTCRLYHAQQKAEELLAIKGRFLANMSHEIRTPMNGIIGLVDMIDSAGSEAKNRKVIGIIRESANSLLNIVNDILDFSQIEAGKLEIQQSPWFLSELVRDVVQMMQPKAQQKGVALNSEFAIADNCRVWVDSVKLEQVLINLIDNAIKFTDEEGSVGFWVSKKAESDIEMTLRFIVQDSGIGIEQDQMDKVFDPFYQIDQSYKKRFQGTGLGLSISKNLVEIMGGSLQVISQLGQGSRFFFDLTMKKADNS